ncbi:MAG: hypothetical protein HZB46_07265 [Solirubrobacterales bacterium]|nr:hypothetical protein [Solirubrobacterales bacterium]
MPLRVRLLLAVLLAALVAAAPARADLSPPAEDFFTLNVQDVFHKFPSDVQRAALFAAAGAKGFGSGRMDVPWSSVEPAAPGAGGTPAYDWTATDRIARELAQGGMRWKPIFDMVPTWASGGATSFVPPTPDRVDEFARFAADFAARYGDGGTFWAANPALPARPVRVFEVWNEPNAERAWDGAPDAAEYVPVYTALRAAIKSVQPSAVVLIGAIFYGNPGDVADDAYIKAMFKAGGDGWAVDGMATHPYAPWAIGVLRNLRRQQAALDASGRGDVPLYVNELSWSAALDPVDAKLHTEQGPSFEQTRQGTVSVLLDTLLASDCRVRDIAIFNLADREDLGGLWGVFRSSGEITPFGQTLSDMAAAYRAATTSPAGRLHPCAGTPAALADQLPLDLALAPDGGCQQATVTYKGFPVELARVRAGAGQALTDALGRARLCAPPSAIYAELSWSDVPAVATTLRPAADPPPGPGDDAGGGQQQQQQPGGGGVTTTTKPSTGGGGTGSRCPCPAGEAAAQGGDDPSAGTTAAQGARATCPIRAVTPRSRRLATVLRKGLVLTVRASSGTASVSLGTRRPDARRLRRGKATITVKLPAKVRSQLRRARRPLVTVAVTLRGAGGCVAARTVTVALKRG